MNTLQSMEDVIISSIACQYPNCLILQNCAVFTSFVPPLHASKFILGPAPPVPAPRFRRLPRARSPVPLIFLAFHCKYNRIRRLLAAFGPLDVWLSAPPGHSPP